MAGVALPTKNRMVGGGEGRGSPLCQDRVGAGTAQRGQRGDSHTELGSAGREKGQQEQHGDIAELVAVPGWWHGCPWGSPWSPAPPEMPKGRRSPVLSLRLWLSRRSMRPTRMIWHTRNSRSRFRSALPRSWGDRQGPCHPGSTAGDVPAPAPGDLGLPRGNRWAQSCPAAPHRGDGGTQPRCPGDLCAPQESQNPAMGTMPGPTVPTGHPRPGSWASGGQPGMA